MSDRYAAPRRDAYPGVSIKEPNSAVPVAPRGKIDYAAGPGRRSAESPGGLRRVDPTARGVAGRTGALRTVDVARRETGRRFANNPGTVVASHWRRSCWNWGLGWWWNCHSGFWGWSGPWWFDPWFSCSWGLNSWWNWSWCRSPWIWSWGWTWCDPFWSWSWYWPWYTSVVYVPGRSTVYVEEPAVIYSDDGVRVIEEEEKPPATAPAESGPSGYAGPESLTEKQVRLGDLYFRAGRYDRAVDAYLRACEYAPEQASLQFMLADALFAIGDYHFAAYSIRKGVEKDAGLVESRANKREFYGTVADFDAQLAKLEKFLADHPNDGDAWLVLGYNHFFTGRPVEARQAFAKAKETLGTDRTVDLFLAAADLRAAEKPGEAPPKPPENR